MSVAVRRPTIQAVRPESVHRPPTGAPGVVLGGKYELEAAIARGGMARVWRAKHVMLNRPVAVKFVDGVGATAETRVETFLREAKVAASVRHKNVVDIIDFGVLGGGAGRLGDPYMVMELLEGETLDERLARGSMTTEEVIDVALQILSGLDAVHRAGIIHRDLKPGNVFLTEDHDGVFARLLDFGISQAADEVVTGVRVVVGTPEYMSPEQAFGDPLDHRSDLYSLGVLMYEMLSGVLPYEDEDPQKVVDLVANGTPLSLIELRPDVPELCSVVERAMMRDPVDRWATGRDMRMAVLDAIGRASETSQRHLTVPRDSRISGTIPRAAITLGAEPAPPSASTSSPPPAAGSPWNAVAISAVLVAILTTTLAWLVIHDQEPTATLEEPGHAEAPAAVEAPTPPPAAPVVEAASAPAERAPAPPEPASEAAADPELELVAPEPETEPDAITPEPRARRRPTKARPRARTGPQGSSPIVRELDF